MSNSWSSSGSEVYIGADGDNMGKRVVKYILANDIKAASSFSKLIHKGEAAIEKFAKKTFGGTFILAGGDDMLLRAPAARFDPQKIESMRKLYKQVTGSTITVGIGSTMIEANKALVVGKYQGKNRAVFWTDDLEETYNKAVKENEKCEGLANSIAKSYQLYKAKKASNKEKKLTSKAASLAKLSRSMRSYGNNKLAAVTKVASKQALKKADSSRKKAIGHAGNAIARGAGPGHFGVKSRRNRTDPEASSTSSRSIPKLDPNKDSKLKKKKKLVDRINRGLRKPRKINPKSVFRFTKTALKGARPS